ncbi:hypothetical protein IHV25_05685 [Phaeovibrio sulfidiphilus]|uniref:Lipoprotein n=1 Tax=Phaeovibrio sulfidiphilus TaxID=1220600 RepID=A0A8J6YWW5_9PROT|nr:hypothetical protein [Phaeovibrio sulfidiphilus]MBE1237137.1 hypothetical protein [Phaeovibrio sulfidiphilus]
MSLRRTIRRNRFSVILTVLVLVCSTALVAGCASKRPGVVAGGTVAGSSSGGKAAVIFDW